jgi:YVTN family beta-propeller protein
LIDARSHAPVGRIDLPRGSGPTPPRPMGVVVSRDGKHAYVSGGRAGSVAVLDLATRRVARTFEAVGARPWGVALSPDGKTLYTANGPSNDVSAIDVRTGEVRARIPSAGSPWGVAFPGG